MRFSFVTNVASELKKKFLEEEGVSLEVVRHSYADLYSFTRAFMKHRDIIDNVSGGYSTNRRLFSSHPRPGSLLRLKRFCAALNVDVLWLIEKHTHPRISRKAAGCIVSLFRSGFLSMLCRRFAIINPIMFVIDREDMSLSSCPGVCSSTMIKTTASLSTTQ